MLNFPVMFAAGSVQSGHSVTAVTQLFHLHNDYKSLVTLDLLS